MRECDLADLKILYKDQQVVNNLYLLYSKSILIELYYNLLLSCFFLKGKIQITNRQQISVLK